MAVTIANIIVGAGALSVDSNDVGGTREGVQMSREAEYLDVTADQHKATLKKFLTDEKRFLRTSLLEATLDNLKILWGGAITTDGEDEILSMAIDAEPTEHALSFVGPAPGSAATRTYAHTRAVQIGTGEHTYAKDNETLLPAEFEILPDLSEPGEEWGTITDNTPAG